MGMFDSMNQSPVQGNGGSFAQKTPMQTQQFQRRAQTAANPVMQGRPSVQSGQPNQILQAMSGPLYGQRPNQMTGQRPMFGNSASIGARGPSRPIPKVNEPLEPAQGLAPTQLPMNPSSGLPNVQTPYDQTASQAQLFNGQEQLGGLGPSNPMELIQPQPVVMDENGLEPRRGPR